MSNTIVTIEARDIPDAWFQCLDKIFIQNKFQVQQGSFVGETRIQFDFIAIEIKYPYQEPYDLMLPDIPKEIGVPNPVESGYVEQYLPYLMTGHVEPNETYTYGQRINECKLDGKSFSQFEHFIEILKETQQTNQAILQIGEPLDCLLEDPPCLRHIGIQIRNNELIFYPYFRSWDLWGGLPANLAGIAVLQHFMAEQIGIKSGSIIASSHGLHLYGYSEELAKMRLHRMI